MTEYNHTRVSQHGATVPVSDRGFPLMQATVPEGYTALTLENYSKWYHVYLVTSTGEVFQVDTKAVMDAMETSHAGWVDHEYHPELLLHLAKALGALINDQTIELAAGRWIMSGHKEKPEFRYSLNDEHDDETSSQDSSVLGREMTHPLVTDDFGTRFAGKPGSELTQEQKAQIDAYNASRKIGNNSQFGGK